MPSSIIIFLAWPGPVRSSEIIEIKRNIFNASRRLILAMKGPKTKHTVIGADHGLPEAALKTQNQMFCVPFFVGQRFTSLAWDVKFSQNRTSFGETCALTKIRHVWGGELLEWTWAGPGQGCFF